MFMPTLFVLIIFIPWYSFNYVKILLLNEKTCIGTTNAWAMHDLKNFWDTTNYRLGILGNYFILIPVMIATTIFSRNKLLKFLNIYFTLPLVLIVFIYGIKNEPFRYMMPAVPMLTINIGCALEEISNNVNYLVVRNRTKIKKGKWTVIIFPVLNNSKTHILAFVFFMILAVALLLLKFPNDRLFSLYDSRQRKIGEKQVNAALYKYYPEGFNKGELLSYYPYINFLPGFAETTITFMFQDVSSYQQMLEIYPSIRYILYPADAVPPTVHEYINGKIKTGEYDLISNLSGYDLIRIKE